MLLFKNSAETLDGVLKYGKHATTGKPHNVNPGDIILIAQTKNTLVHNQKPIRWIMNFVSVEEDHDNLSDKIWGKHWRYIIHGENVRSIEPFDIDEIKNSSKKYGPIQTHCSVLPEDEEVIIEWISEISDTKADMREIISDEFRDGRSLDPDELIEKLDLKYSNSPQFKETVVKTIQRPSALSNAIKEKFGHKCMICGYPGEKYAEVHHMLELNKLAPKTLQSWNLIVVCPLCHKKLHFSEVKTELLNPGWKIILDGKIHTIV